MKPYLLQDGGRGRFSSDGEASDVLNLLADLKESLGISLLTISHDLALVRQLADDVVVMCQGERVESGTVDDVLTNPQHDYTRRLVDAVPENMSRSMAAARGETPKDGESSPPAGAS